MNRLLGLLALTLPLTACAIEPSLATVDQEIVGGTVTPDGVHPAVGALVIPVGDENLLGCTGTLIAPDVVLTASHCLAGLEGFIPSFTLANDINAEATVVAGRALVVHEDFVDEEPGDFLGDYHDIGLLLLAQPIRDVTPVELIRADQALAADLELVIVGYGRTSDDSALEGVKRHATTALVELAASEIQVSRGQGEPQNCVGDSGGPSFADLGDGLQQVSVVSRSHAADDCQNGGIHTRVDVYLDWIDANLPAPAGDGGGGCSTSSGQGSGAVLLMLLIAALLGRGVRDRRGAWTGSGSSI